MNVEPAGFLPALHEIRIGPSGEIASSVSFASWLGQRLSETNAKLIQSDRQLQRLALGETDNLHHVMISLEEAKLAFQLVVQARNKMLEAYQDILRMQI
jgi:flagellar hook-basal body complex protein FliE